MGDRVNTKILQLSDFKEQLKFDLKPERYKHFSKGSKIGNTLLARIRLNRSGLNLHRFTIGQSETAECICSAKKESSLHYLIDCFLYTGERQTLFNLVEYYVPSFKTMCKNKKYEVLIMGIDPGNPEFVNTNTILSIAVQKFIFGTKRFSN